MPQTKQAVSLTANALMSHGIRCFPTKWQSKHPIIPADWRELATADIHEFDRLCQPYSQIGLAIALGPGSGIIDLELDGPEAQKEFYTLCEIFGLDLHTIAYSSYRGCHYLFRWSPELEAFGKAVTKVRGIELRMGQSGKGAYSIAPPSLHETGELFYTWLDGCSPWETRVSGLPRPLLDFLQAAAEKTKSSTSVIEGAAEDFLPAPGQRHEVALRLCHLLRGHARFSNELVFEMMMTFQEVTGKLDEYGEELCSKEIKDILRSVPLSHKGDDDFALIDFGEMYASASQLRNVVVKETEAVAEMPAVMPPWMEELGTLFRHRQVPRHLVLMAGLTAISAAAGATVNIRSSDFAPVTGLQLYTMGIGTSGSGKSRAMKTMLHPLSDDEGFITNVTPEALMACLGKNPRGALLKIVEGKQLTRMMGNYNETTDNSVLLEAWSGDTIAVRRREEKNNVTIKDPFLSIAATVQPYNLERTFGVTDVMEGFLQRLLIYEADAVPEEPDTTNSERLNDLMGGYINTLARIKSIRPMFMDPLMREALKDQPTAMELTTGPLKLVLSEEAHKNWMAYARYKRSRDTLEMFPEEHPFRTDLLRHAEYALRLAGCLYLLDVASSATLWKKEKLEGRGSAEVPVEYIDRAVQLMEWLWNEKQRIMLEIVEDRFHAACPAYSLRSMQNLPEAIQRFTDRRKRILLARLKGEETWSVRDYYRNLRLNADTAQSEVEFLVQSKMVEEVISDGKATKYRFVKKERGPSRIVLP
jgi:hypothetical protein